MTQEPLWSDDAIEAEVRRIGDNMRLYIADACAVAEKVRDEYEAALAAANQRIKRLEAEKQEALALLRDAGLPIADIEVEIIEGGNDLPLAGQPFSSPR